MEETQKTHDGCERCIMSGEGGRVGVGERSGREGGSASQEGARRKERDAACVHIYMYIHI